MKVLVTGGGGFLGLSIVKLLHKRGHDVCSLSRSKYDSLDKLRVKQISCNISNRDDVFNKVKGFDAIIHTAAKAGVWGRPEDFYNINYIGTKNIIDAALENGITKLVYTSTPSVAFGHDDLEGVDESTPYPPEYLTDYAKTKSLAEQYVLSKASDLFRCCAIRPHLIWGPNDPHILPRLKQRALSGKMRVIGEGKNLVDIVYVDNAAEAHVLALENINVNESINGSAYFVGQESPVNLWKFINSMLKTQKISPIEKTISFDTAYRLGSIFEKFYRAFKVYKKDPPMTRFVALQMAKSHYFSHQKAKNDFGYFAKVSIEEGLNRL